MTEAVLMRYANGKYIRESEYRPPKTSRGYADHTWTTTNDISCGRLRLVVYSLQRDVSWSLSFQETMERMLTQDIGKIVKLVEDSVEVMRKEIIEAEQRAEVRRREWEDQHARWERERDQQQIAHSIKESREQLAQVIQSWATIMNIEQFLKGVEERAIALPEAQREQLLDRLQLAREFIGTQDPLEFFNSWKTPSERYMPLAKRKFSI
jgi:dGTP triphosphohydrolase